MVINDDRPLKIINAFENKSAAIIKIQNIKDTFLYVVKFLDGRISGYLRESQEALNFYYTVEDERTGIKISFIFIYLVVVTLLLFLSISIGIRFSSRFFRSINNLISASYNIGKGNLKSKVPEIKSDIELETLNKNFNMMIDQLKNQQDKLLISERHEAWESVARKLAHEIKNPLTPMRLTIQSFEKNFNPGDGKNKNKIRDFSKSLIEQIDTMSSIATAFSNFANMPEQKRELLNVVEVVQIALDIFDKDYVEYTTENDEILTLFDRTQLIRVVTNLLNNAIQAIPEDRDPMIFVKVHSNKKNVVINIQDNGNGILEENKTKIFEPSFTTKSSGMGLGLSMIQSIMKAYNGSITFKTKENQGTTFNVVFPKKLK